MLGVGKTLTRVVVLGALGVGVLVAVAGTDRAAAVFHQARHAVQSTIDGSISETLSLRTQLRSLASKYPVRIAEVRSQLAKITGQAARIGRDKAVADRVVQMAGDDLEELRGLVDEATAVLVENPSVSRGRVRVRFKADKLSLDGAYTAMRDLQQTVDMYADRAADCVRDASAIRRDAERLEDLLAKLESEHADFRRQLAQLDGQIDALERKERIVGFMEERQRRIDELSAYQAHTLDHISGKIGRRFAELDAKLDTLERGERRSDYERVAGTEIDEAARKAQRQRREAETGTGAEEIIIAPGGR